MLEQSQPTKEEYEKKYGGDSSEYPPETNEHQRKLSEQRATHMKWCEENGFDPKENEFYIDQQYYWNDEGKLRYGKSFITGKYKGKEVYIYAGADLQLDANYNQFTSKLEMPVIEIEGEDRLTGKHDVHKRAKELMEKLSPYAAYDMQFVRYSQEQITREDEWERKGKPAAEKWRREKQVALEREQAGQSALRQALELDPATTEAKLGEALKLVNEVTLDEKYGPYGREYGDLTFQVERTEAILETLRKRREVLIAALGLDQAQVELAVSGGPFESKVVGKQEYVNRYALMGPHHWTADIVDQKQIGMSGTLNGVAVKVATSKRREVTQERNSWLNHTESDLDWEFALNLAKENGYAQKQGWQKKSDFLSHMQQFGDIARMEAEVGTEKAKMTSAGPEADQLFKTLLTLGNYTAVLEGYIAKIKVKAEKRHQEKIAREQSKEAEAKKIADALKKLDDLF